RGVEGQAIAGNRRLEAVALGAGEPFIKVGAGGLLAGVGLGPSVRYFLGQRVPARAVLTHRHGNDRWRVADVAVHRPLGRIVEYGRHFVKLALGERVKLMIVADSTIGGQAEPDARGRLGPVAGIENQILFIDGAALVSRDVAAVEAGGDPLLERR